MDKYLRKLSILENLRAYSLQLMIGNENDRKLGSKLLLR